MHSPAHLSILRTFVNSTKRTHLVSNWRFNPCVDNKTIRRLNLLGLIDQHGTIARLAKATNSVANYLSQVKNGHRDMGDDQARRLEAALSKEKGWMDTPQFGSPDEAMSQTEALQILQSLKAGDREAWLRHGRLMVENNTERGPHNPFGPVKKGGTH